MYTPLLQSSGALQAAGVQWVSSTTPGEFNGTITTATVSHTVPVGSNRILLVSVNTRASSSGVTPVGVTYGGVPLTLITIQRNDVPSPQPISVSFWYLLAPAEGTANIVVTWPVTPIRYSVAASNFINVNQTKPIEAFAGSSSLGTVISTSVTTLTGTGMIVDSVYHLDGPWTAGQGQEQIQAVFVNDGHAASYKPSPTVGGATTMSWLNVVSQSWAQVVVVVASSAAQFTGTIRPSQDIMTTGWKAVNGLLYLDSDPLYLDSGVLLLSEGATSNDNLYDMVNEVSASDTDYILSPPLTGPLKTAVFELEKELPAEFYNLRIRARRTITGSGSVRLILQNRYGEAVGTSSWQPLTDTFDTYTFQLNTTGPATRAAIEVQL